MRERILYRADGLPVFQNVALATRLDAEKFPQGSIRLVEDRVTGLVRNAAFDPALLTYDARYQNEQGFSEVFQHHLGEVENVIERHMGGTKIVEIGCGKGQFLENMLARGWDAQGVDPAYEGSNPRIVKSEFNRAVARDCDGVVLRHVLEHIHDPFRFLQEIADWKGNRGLIYIEVPCFDWICRTRAWFDIFFEHVNYFRMTDFRRFFGRIEAAGHLFGGQYLYVVADLSTLQRPEWNARDAVEFPVDILSGLKRMEQLPDHPRAIWGAASKGVIFALQMRNMHVRVDFAVDMNPEKQNRFLPVSGLEVLSPAAAMKHLPQGGEILIMNANYRDEIAQQTENRYSYVLAEDI